MLRDLSLVDLDLPFLEKNESQCKEKSGERGGGGEREEGEERKGGRGEGGREGGREREREWIMDTIQERLTLLASE